MNESVWVAFTSKRLKYIKIETVLAVAPAGQAGDTRRLSAICSNYLASQLNRQAQQ